MKAPVQQTKLMEDLRAEKWWRGIAPGDTVHFTTPHAKQKKGVVRISTPTHVVINTGGKHGTPALVNDDNFLSHTPSKK